MPVTALGTAQEGIFLQWYQVLALHLVHSGFDGLVHATTAESQQQQQQQDSSGSNGSSSAAMGVIKAQTRAYIQP